MHYKFPYFEDRPHIPVALEFGGKKARFLPLLDSGADFSIFYKSDAVRLGLKWNDGKKVELSNADGSTFKAREFNIKVGIENKNFKAKICFINNKKHSIPLLGRKDIFKHFKITINEKEKCVGLQTLS